jgi:hypothetical protein
MASSCTEPVSGAGFLAIGLAFIGASLASDQSGLLGVGFAVLGIALASTIRRHRSPCR